MRFAPEALFLFLGASVASAQVSGPLPTPSVSASASPSPSPSPRPGAKLLPYWYETEAQRSTGPLLHFEDRAEVRALEMNAAIARFFDKDGSGDMLRGATPGGAPTLADMKNHRPHVSPSIDFLSLAMWAANLGKGAVARRYKSRVERNDELLRALLLGEHPTPAPSPFNSGTEPRLVDRSPSAAQAPSPAASPSPSPTPIRAKAAGVPGATPTPNPR